MAGEQTRAGSKVLAEEAKPAAADAPVVRRLRAAGAVIVAKTNMTEFAYSVIGINPHFGTPGNPRDRERIPGGSSSGAAVAAADGMSEIAIGTDTGGSVRIPAAFCGMVGFKPTKRACRPTARSRYFTLNSIGPLALSVADCADADAVLAGEAPAPLEPARSIVCASDLRGPAARRSRPPCRRRFAAAVKRLDDAGGASAGKNLRSSTR